MIPDNDNDLDPDNPDGELPDDRDWAKWVNEATSPDERHRRKAVAFPYLYGPQPK